MKLVSLFLASAALITAQSFDVVHKKPYWPDGRGRIHITPEGVQFEAQDETRSRRWSYPDMQHFDRVSRSEFVITTYEDQTWRLGRDRRFRFVITGGELSDPIVETVRQRLQKPVTDRVVGEVAAGYELPAKHLHVLGGCEGRLVFSQDSLYYATDLAEDAREWRFASDIQAISSMDPYHLEVRVFEDNRSEFSHSRRYRFALKQPLDPDFYRSLKLRLYDLESPGVP